jgi:N-acetylmuramoyl-L-alanine amidase/Putative peptidoglycan binding domain
MAYSLTWLPRTLLEAGLKVAETQGWADRGRAEMGPVKGVMCHHTGTAAPGNMPTLNVLINGRPGLSGPLCQLGLGRDGTYYVVAAGRANHAGEGRWKGLTNGNSNFIGIEAENDGGKTTPWPEVQMDAYRRGVAAILRKIGADVSMCCGHREYALPPGRKPDPVFDMDAFRDGVAQIMAGRQSVKLIEAVDATGRPTLRRGARGAAVKELQTKLGLSADGIFGPMTEVAARRFQAGHDLVPDGIVGPKTWAAMG